MNFNLSYLQKLTKQLWITDFHSATLCLDELVV